MTTTARRRRRTRGSEIETACLGRSTLLSGPARATGELGNRLPPSVNLPEPSELRASDADRERVARELRDHCAAGRLTPDELEQRLGAVFTSSSDRQLAEVSRDLPAMAAGSVKLTPGDLARRQLLQEAVRLAIVNVLCIGAWLASGAHAQFWPIWVLLVSLVRVAQDGWALVGPTADLEVEPGSRLLEHQMRRAERGAHRHRGRLGP